ncbi:MAG: 6-hydroxymethylpterin diphosphokinase MptE-like protein [Phycisphaerae bacterium]
MSDAAAPAVGNERFLHNMRALWRHDAELALRVDAVHDDERVSLEATRSGAWTAKMPTSEGSMVYLHSRYDPVAEAERFAASIPLEDKFCFVVSGLGLGYHVRALFERLRGDAFIICSEPSIQLIATALTCVDLAELIESKRLVILTDSSKTRLHERLKAYNTLMMLGAQFVRHPPSMRVAEKAHRAVTEAIAEFVTYTRMTLVTLVSNSRITCKNIAMNLVNYVTTPPIGILRDRFARDPAVIVSAGPSLSRNIDQLVDLKGRAVICAVQTAVKPLMARGLVPDFITSLDFHEMSRRFFEGVGDLSGAHLVAEPKATWHVVDNYSGPVSLLDNGWARLVIGDGLGERGGLKAGATVAHLAFYLAMHMGCDPIIFVGQDLAFTGHVFYIPGVEIHHTWRSELNRFNTMEQKEWDRIVRNRPILRRVPGTDGGELYTDELLFTYLEQFEKDIADVPRRVINATEGGARIRGTETMTLREAAGRFCSRKIDPQRFAYRDTVRRRDPSRLGATGVQIERRIEELEGVVELCEELLTLLTELDGLTHDPPRFNRRLVRVDELRTKVQQESLAYRIVAAFTQLAELRRFSADRHISACETDDTERAKRQVARDIEFITGIRDGAVDIKPILTEALRRISEARGPA